jgi:hypothetical protein
VLKSRIVDAPAPDYGEQPASLAVEQFTTTNTSCELKLRLVGQLGAYGRDANGMPVRVSVDGENKVVRIEQIDDAFGATARATAVEGAGNMRVYRFTFPFASLSGFLNGDRNAVVPVPASDIVKVHLTFAPRFEDVEYGLAAGHHPLLLPARARSLSWDMARARCWADRGQDRRWRASHSRSLFERL